MRTSRETLVSLKGISRIKPLLRQRRELVVPGVPCQSSSHIAEPTNHHTYIVAKYNIANTYAHIYTYIYIYIYIYIYVCVCVRVYRLNVYIYTRLHIYI